MMKAIVQTGYGGPEQFELQEIDRPEVGTDGVLVRVHAASINAGDWRIMLGRPYLGRLMMGGLRKPKEPVRGSDVAGVVEAVGPDVKHLAPGDEVYGARYGSFAEYVCGRERNFVPKPRNLTFEEAAAIPIAGVTALQGLRDKGGIEAGQRVLINGAAGGVGTFAVQMAKAFGARVTAVCSTRNVELVRSLGADEVVDYTRDDFTRSGERYDLVFDIVGNRSLRALRRVLAPNGRLVLAGGDSLFLLLHGFVRSKLGANIGLFIAKINSDDLLFLKELAEEGKIRPVIDRTYALTDVPEAVGQLSTGHGRAKTVIAVA
jgi:NADPH:quinone reductase-like Zn-dependent oxidoreductase